MRASDLVAAVAAAAGVGRPAALGLYVHVPYCASKCHFCDWVVDVPVERLRSGPSERGDYVRALCRQIEYFGPLLTGSGYRPDVMYWGGGTPTRLEPDELQAIGATLDAGFDLSTLRQWSVESTPNDLTAVKLETLRRIGVDRISIGAQSFDRDQLRRSGRIHTAEQIEDAVRLVRDAGITTFNIDLIVGFPGESMDAQRRTLHRALALAPPHLSVYPYRATPKTIMAMQLERETLAGQTETRMVAAYEQAMAVLGDAGYHEYCHGYWVRSAEHEDQDGNHKYDLAGDKIGFGSGAESIIGHHLLWNENGRHTDYLADPLAFSAAHRFSLDEPERMTALVGGALMTRDGVDFERFEQLTGVRFTDLRATAYLQNWLGALQECGARYQETSTRLRIDPAVVHRAYIGHLAATMSAGIETARA